MGNDKQTNLPMPFNVIDQLVQSQVWPGLLTPSIALLFLGRHTPGRTPTDQRKHSSQWQLDKAASLSGLLIEA